MLFGRDQVKVRQRGARLPSYKRWDIKSQRFTDYGDLDEHECTIEEREEYEPHIDSGMKITKPYQRVRYELQEIGRPTLNDDLMKFGKKK